MCQVTPFTLPCCRRIYVSVEKLPSCPETWPKSKCPPELCIQLGGYEAKDAEHKQSGICWRCSASMFGAVGHHRECRRPGIDRAFIVPGLVELGPADRRKLAEANGICWFCSAKGDCDICGGRGINVGVGNKKGADREERLGDGNNKGPNKRLKMENAAGMTQTPSRMLPPPSLQYNTRASFQQPYYNTSGEFVCSAGTSTLANCNTFHAESPSLQSDIDPTLLPWQPAQTQNRFQSSNSEPIFQSNATEEHSPGRRYKGSLGASLLGNPMQVLGADFAPRQIHPGVQDEDLEFFQTLETFNKDLLNFEPLRLPKVEQVPMGGMQSTATNSTLK